MHIPKGEHVEWCREYNCEGCVEDSFDAGYAAALDAAEAAVAEKRTQIAEDLIEHLWGTEYPSDEGDCCAELVVNLVLSAISALREEK